MLVAILDDDRSRCAEMKRSMAQVAPDVTLEIFDSAPDMIAWLARHIEEVALVSLAHDLGPSRLRDGMLFDPGTGRDVTDFLVEMDTSFPVIVHAADRSGSRSMIAVLEHSGWPNARVEPEVDMAWISGAWASHVIDMLSGSKGK